MANESSRDDGARYRREINEFNKQARESKIGATPNEQVNITQQFLANKHVLPEGRKEQGEVTWGVDSAPFATQALLSEKHASPRFRIRQEINEINAKARDSKIRVNADYHADDTQFDGMYNESIPNVEKISQQLMMSEHEANSDGEIRATAPIAQQLLNDKHRIDAGKVREDINEFNRQARESKIKADAEYHTDDVQLSGDKIKSSFTGESRRAFIKDRLSHNPMLEKPDEPKRSFVSNPLAVDNFQDGDFDGNIVAGPSYESLRYCRLDNASKEIKHTPFQETHATSSDINCQAALSGHDYLKKLLTLQADRVGIDHDKDSFAEYADRVKNLSREDYKPKGYFIGGYKVPTEFVTPTEMQQLRSKATTELANMRPIERRVHIHNFEPYYKQLGMDMSYADRAWSGMTPETLFKDECIVPIEKQSTKIKLRLNSIENSGLPNFGASNSNENVGYGPDNTQFD